MGFISDLLEGEEYERKVAEALYWAYWITLSKNTDKKGTDLTHELFNIEVKYDRKLKETGNIFIEIAYKWADSGLFKEDYGIYVHWDDEGFWIFDAHKLRENILDWIEDGKYKTINGWDGWKSKWVLIPRQDLDEEAIRFIKL